MAGEEMQRGKTCAAERDDRDGRGGGVRFCCSSKITGDSSPPGAPPQRPAGQRQRAARRPRGPQRLKEG